MALAVAHLIYGLDLGGLEQLVVQLADRSRRRGIETSILALGEDGPVRELALRSGIDVELLPVSPEMFDSIWKTAFKPPPSDSVPRTPRRDEFELRRETHGFEPSVCLPLTSS